jgi:pimeloyl-ACP methyl ester carboxylesterase
MQKALNKFIPLAYGAYFNSLSLFSQQKAVKIAFQLSCTPRKGKVLPAQSAYLDDARHQRLKAMNIELQTYQWKGDNDTVLLLHGWESNSFRWRKLIPFLKEENYNIIAFDAPAHGNSTGSIFNVALYTECTKVIVDTYKPKVIIGHSVGGMNTLYNQEKYPNPEIEKIVTIGSPSKLQDVMRQYQQLLKFNDVVYNGLDDYILKNYGFRIHEFNSSDFKGHLDKKGLIIHDRRDTIVPFSASEPVHAAWENSEFYTTDGYGHSMHQDEVNLRILDFIKS